MKHCHPTCAIKHRWRSWRRELLHIISSQDVYWLMMWYSDWEPDLIQLRLTSWASSIGWSRQARQARLSYPSKKSSPGGYHSRNPSLPTTEKPRSLTPTLRPASVACTVRWCRHTRAHINLHAPLSPADSGVLRVTLLNFSPSFPSLVFPLSWQELLAPLPPAITLSLSLSYSHPFNSLLSFQLPRVFFSLSVHSPFSSS